MVLVILAILAAVVIPAFTGYIDKAKRGEYLVMAHTAMEAAQSIALEAYAEGTVFDGWRGFTNITDKNGVIQNKIYELSGIDKNKYVIANADINAKGQIIFLNFYSKKTYNGQPNRVVYCNGTIGGKKYNGELIVTCWNGEQYYNYQSLDPAQAGYKKE